MNWVALKMLTGDRAKYLGIVFGVAFAALLMSQQLSMFVGIMRRTTSQIRDVQEADIWVMDQRVRQVDEIRPLPNTDLHRVRGVPGVAWAVRFYKGLVQARVEGGEYRQVVLLGVDDATLVGGPREMVLGDLADLRRPGAVVVDLAGYHLLWPGQSLELGKVLEMNDRRAVLVGVCQASAPFQTSPIMYTRYREAVEYGPQQRNQMSFVLAKAQEGQDASAVARRVQEQTGLQALTGEEFARKTIGYYLRSTGIPANFGITVALGFIVGCAIAGQTFYLFTVENLKQFGALKAMGVSNGRLVRMILLQGLVVGVLGYAAGMGMTALVLQLSGYVENLRGLFMPWHVMLGTGVGVLLIVTLSSLLSVRRVLVLEPAVVFRG
jgi:putative ABC transport system permease protein